VISSLLQPQFYLAAHEAPGGSNRAWHTGHLWQVIRIWPALDLAARASALKYQPSFFCTTRTGVDQRGRVIA
jgi:hypothetical protein